MTSIETGGHRTKSVTHTASPAVTGECGSFGSGQIFISPPRLGEAALYKRGPKIYTSNITARHYSAERIESLKPLSAWVGIDVLALHLATRNHRRECILCLLTARLAHLRRIDAREADPTVCLLDVCAPDGVTVNYRGR